MDNVKEKEEIFVDNVLEIVGKYTNNEISESQSRDQIEGLCAETFKQFQIDGLDRLTYKTVARELISDAVKAKHPKITEMENDYGESNSHYHAFSER